MIVRTRRLLAGGLAATVLVGGLVAAGPTASAANVQEDAFTVPGSYDWTVPSWVTSVEIVVVGAGGGDGQSGVHGGRGGFMVGEFDVTPGDTLKAHVGGRGADAGDGNGGAGGANGGGSGVGSCFSGGGGGGASDVRTSGDHLSDRIIVAGGGGGAAPDMMGGGGGDGGGDIPTDGGGGAGGDAGSSVGGAGGVGSDGTGFAGTLGNGGAGAVYLLCITTGGGGGGYYGGGGGGHNTSGGAGGGGGGSAYISVDGDLLEAGNGEESGNGSVVFRYAVQPPATTTTTTTAPATTTTTTTPAPVPEAPKANCPTPIPGLRVYPNAFSVTVAAYLMEHCGSTARQVNVHGESLVVLDPPAGGVCPTWRAARVMPERNSVVLASLLIQHCAYTATMQRDSRTSASVWVVPSGWPTGARAFG